MSEGCEFSICPYCGILETCDGLFADKVVCVQCRDTVMLHSKIRQREIQSNKPDHGEGYAAYLKEVDMATRKAVLKDMGYWEDGRVVING